MPKTQFCVDGCFRLLLVLSVEVRVHIYKELVEVAIVIETKFLMLAVIVHERL